LVTGSIKELNECQNSHMDLLGYTVQNTNFFFFISSGYLHQKGSFRWF